MDIPNKEIIRDIWNRSNGAYGFFATLHRPVPGTSEAGRFTEYIVVTEDEAQGPMHEHMTNQCDLFFTPLRFSAQRRSNETVFDPGVLYADLDAVDPRNLELPPSYAWETSPGNYQGVWIVKDLPGLPYDRFADINRRLSYHVGADRGGWMGSKVLRVPGSYNYKRNAWSRLLWDNMGEYDLNEITRWVPPLEAAEPPEAQDYPTPLLAPKDRDFLLRQYWDQMSLLGRSMVCKEKVPDRSLHIVRTANELISGGLYPEAVFHLLWVAPWNKWRTDRDAPDKLWGEVLRAAGE